MRQREIEDVLEAGENLLWEGRPVGWPRPTLGRVLVALVLAAVAVAVASVTVGIVFGRGDIFAITLGGSYVQYSLHGRSTLLGRGVLSQRHIDVPIVVFLPLGLVGAGASELVALARFRARRYGITDRRVLELDHKGRVFSAPRDAHAPALTRRTLVYGPVRFEGIVDGEAALSVLESRA